MPPPWRAHTARPNGVRRQPVMRTDVSTSKRLPKSWRRIAIRSGSAKCGKAGTRSRRRSRKTSSATSSSPTKARASWDSRIPARCGDRSTTCRRTSSPKSSIGCGNRCGRCTCRCTRMSARSCARTTATRFRPADHCQRISSATSGHKTGPTCSRWCQPPAPIPGYDLTAILKARKMTPVDMVKAGERFYTSLGFAPLPQTFWERSLLSKPRDREVVCHASAWDIDSVEDLRIKMCIDPTAEDFRPSITSSGHNIYQRAYNKLPVLFRDSANEGFHEAIGDTIALSVTPEYLVKIGLLPKAPGCVARHRAAAAAGALEDRVPAVWNCHRSVAMESLQRRGDARHLQQGMVGSAVEVSGRGAAGTARRGIL